MRECACICVYACVCVFVFLCVLAVYKTLDRRGWTSLPTMSDRHRPAPVQQADELGVESGVGGRAIATIPEIHREVEYGCDKRK